MFLLEASGYPRTQALGGPGYEASFRYISGRRGNEYSSC